MVAMVKAVPKVVIVVAAVAGVATVAAVLNVLAVAAVSVVVMQSGGGCWGRRLIGGLQPMRLSNPVVAVVELETRDGRARLNLDV